MLPTWVYIKETSYYSSNCEYCVLMGRNARAGLWIEQLLIYKMVQQVALPVKILPKRPRRVTCVKTKSQGVYTKSGRSNTLKPQQQNQ